jgi:hypothetical protein
VDAASYLEFPLVDSEMSVELFGPQDDEIGAMQREIWQAIRWSLTKDIQNLKTASADELEQNLHKIFGYSSNAALLRLGIVLKDWLELPEPHESAADFLPLALETATLSIAEIENLFPQLQRALRNLTEQAPP